MYIISHVIVGLIVGIGVFIKFEECRTVKDLVNECLQGMLFGWLAVGAIVISRTVSFILYIIKRVKNLDFWSIELK